MKKLIEYGLAKRDVKEIDETLAEFLNWIESNRITNGQLIGDMRLTVSYFYGDTNLTLLGRRSETDEEEAARERKESYISEEEVRQACKKKETAADKETKLLELYKQLRDKFEPQFTTTKEVTWEATPSKD